MLSSFFFVLQRFWQRFAREKCTPAKRKPGINGIHENFAIKTKLKLLYRTLLIVFCLINVFFVDLFVFRTLSN